MAAGKPKFYKGEATMLSFKTKSAGETIALGEALGKKLLPGAVVALNGGLGAGKTYLSKGIARGLGFPGEVKSPTFTLINIYEGRVPVYHFDCYRLKNNADLENIGYEEYFFGDNYCFIEWPQIAEGLMPDMYIKVEMTEEKGERKCKLIYVDVTLSVIWTSVKRK